MPSLFKIAFYKKNKASEEPCFDISSEDKE